MTTISLIQVTVVIPAADSADTQVVLATSAPVSSSPQPPSSELTEPVPDGTTSGTSPAPTGTGSATGGEGSTDASETLPGTATATPSATPTPLPIPPASDGVPVDSLATLGAALDGGNVQVFGQVPDAAGRTALIDRVREATGGGVSDRLSIVPGSGTVGTDGFVAVLRALGSQSRATTVALRTGRLNVTGVLPDAATLEQVRRAARATVAPASMITERLAVDASGQVTPAQVAAQITALPGLTFDSKSASLSAAAQQVVQVAAQILKGRNDIRVTVEGHTDTSGKATTNLRLSRERAAAVGKALVTAGVAASRVNTVGYGETRPLLSGGSDYADAVNRRVVLVSTVGI